MANAFKNLKSRNIGTGATTIGAYTVPAATTATIIGLSLANTNPTPVTASVIINDGTNDTYVLKNATIPVGSALVPFGGDQKMVLVANDKVNIISSAATSIDAIMSVLEIS
jgi:hypothetical protein